MPDADTPPEGRTPGGVREVLGNRSAVALLVAMTCATMASTAQFTALGKFVFDSTRRPLDLGLIGLAEFLPAAVLVVVSGAVADRFDRRRVAATAFLGEAVVVVVLALLAARTLDGIALVLCVVVAFGTFRALGAPSGRSLPAMVVAPETVPRMMAFFAGSWQVGLIAGPVLGGFLYVVSPSAPFVAAAALLVVAGLLLLTLRYHPEADLRTDDPAAAAGGRQGLRTALEGLRFVRRTPILLGAISLDLFAVLFGGAVALLPAIATDQLGVGSVGLGWLRAAGGIGAALTTAYLAARPLRRRVGRTLFVAVAVFGAATVVLGVTRTYAVALLAILVLSAADSVSVFIRVSIIPLVTPNEVRGRVFAVENVFIGASNELGGFESGLAAALIGVPGAVVLGGVATVVVVGLWSWWFPALRDVDHFDDLGGTPDPVGTTMEAATAIEADRQERNPL